ncbi:hypothetical protein FB451DRAFT_1257852 [Mycena latifolia]|nr:hypothetical protein FB451DRAFT_1257852 [Mycena latifolia]
MFFRLQLCTLTRSRRVPFACPRCSAPLVRWSSSRRKPILKTILRDEFPLPLPRAAIPPHSTDERDPWTDLLPGLYEKYWGLDYVHPERAEQVPGVIVLRRTFLFPPAPSKELLTFVENTQDMPLSNLIVFRSLSECDVYLRSPAGVTPALIDLAHSFQDAYDQLVPDFPAPFVKPIHRVTTFDDAATLARRLLKKGRPIADPPEFVLTAPTALPPAPPAPALPPPPITDTDLPTYIAPLVASGWCISGVKAVNRFQAEREAFRALPSLSRMYRFHTYPAARQFFTAVVALIPPERAVQSERASVPATVTSAPDPVYPGVEVRFAKYENRVEVWTISELAEGAERPFGISHADVRFAIAVETLFAEKFTQHAHNIALKKRWVPTQMSEVWDYQNHNHSPKAGHNPLHELGPDSPGATGGDLQTGAQKSASGDRGLPPHLLLARKP